MAGLKYWIWLSARKGLGPVGALRLLEHFGSPERIYYADPEEYAMVEGIPSAVVRLLKDKNMDGTNRILADCDRLGLRMMTLRDAGYPERLSNIPDPPLVLYIKGKMPDFDEEAVIGVVGTRKPTVYGLEMAEKLGYELTRGGALVVSGIARGLDTAALRGALRAGGPVVSVLGGGTDVYYPRENRFLYEDVAAAGALISEYPPGTENIAGHFPIRNRIISGLSLGVVAVECEERSGTMSTVNRAWDQDRDVFAVPGPVNAPMSRGPNLIIQKAGKLVRCGEDILEEYRSRYPEKLGEYRLEEQPMPVWQPEQTAAAGARPESIPQPQKIQPELEKVGREEERSRFTDDELAVLRAIGRATRCADELVELTRIPVRRVTTALTMLQVCGAVEEQEGRRFTSLIQLES